jgi:ABC-2 type transport system ATP-binding protein
MWMVDHHVAAGKTPRLTRVGAARRHDDFELPPRRPVKRLSRGMRSAVGLAARAELTLFDEPYAGLDAVARRLFYDRLLAEIAAYPRTVLLSTHLVDEAAGLLEHVVMLDRGRVVLNAPADDLRGAAVTVTGPATAVEEFVTGRPVWDRQRLGSRASVTVGGPLDAGDQACARVLHLNLEPLSLQQLLVHASGLAAGEKVTA